MSVPHRLKSLKFMQISVKLARQVRLVTHHLFQRLFVRQEVFAAILVKATGQFIGQSLLAAFAVRLGQFFDELANQSGGPSTLLWQLSPVLIKSVGKGQL